MTEREELEARRIWDDQIVSAMRLWSNATDYREGCRAWTDVQALLNSRPKRSEAA